MKTHMSQEDPKLLVKNIAAEGGWIHLSLRDEVEVKCKGCWTPAVGYI